MEALRGRAPMPSRGTGGGMEVMSVPTHPPEPDAATAAATSTSTATEPASGSEDAQAAEQARDRELLRLAAVTTGWWAHGLVRLLLASALVYYGVAKLVLGQFGVADTGDALITQGEMSPMGMLWRMVALSPLFQFLAGLTEFGAALALLWRRTVPLGGLLAFASMVFVFVLNLGYDVPVKQISLALALLRSEEHTSELQSRGHLVCRLLLVKKNEKVFYILLDKERLFSDIPHHSPVQRRLSRI